jgi:hypothetical protein
MKEGMKRILKELMTKKILAKLTFKYPRFNNETYKSGMIKEVQDDCFIVEERLDGISAYSYDFLTDVKGEVMK